MFWWLWCWKCFEKNEQILINDKNININVFRIQALDLIMSRYFYITYIAFMLKDERMIDFINPFSPYNFKANDKKILEYFQLAW